MPPTRPDLKEKRRQEVLDRLPVKAEPPPPEAREQARSAQVETARQAIIATAFEAPDKAADISTVERQALSHEYATLTAALMEEKRELGKLSFWYFHTRICYPNSWAQHYTEAFHEPIAQVLQDLRKGTNQLLVVPREHRKSFLLLSYCLWLIVRDPNIRIMLIGAKESTSSKWATLVRNAFISGTAGFEHFREVYHEFVIDPTKSGLLLQAKQFTHPLRHKVLSDPTIFATYLGVTGAGGRADVQIFDDPYERRNVSTPEQSLKSLQQTLDLFPLIEIAEGSVYCNRIFAVTRWAFHDPTSAFLGERHEESSDMETVDLPPFQAMVRHAFEDPNRLCESCPPHVVRMWPHGHPDVVKGDPIMAPIIIREGLMARHAEYCSDPARGESLWYHQYQNVCQAPSDQKFKAEWFITAHYPILASHRKRIVAIDSADKDFQREGIGDYMVALFGEYDDFGKLLLVHGIRSNKWTRDEFQRRIITWSQATGWWPHVAVKEKFGEDSFLTDMRRCYMDQQRPVHAIAVIRPGREGTGGFVKKLDWIVSSLQAPVERAEVVFGSKFPEDVRNRAVYELTSLGQAKNDDIADTMALFFAPDVRVVRPAARGLATAQPLPPALDLYSPDAPMPSPFLDPSAPLTPIQQAMRSKSFRMIVTELPSIREEAPEGLLHIVPDI